MPRCGRLPRFHRSTPPCEHGLVNTSPAKSVLLFEFLALFVALPLAFRFKPFYFPPLPALWLALAYCYWRLKRDPSFDHALLWNSASLPRFAPAVFATFCVVAALIGIGVWMLAPAKLFGFVRTHTLFWAVIMCAYPIVSVYPQSLIYRAFFFHRYRSLLPSSGVSLVASAAAFSFIHIIFRNPIAPLFTFFGGLLFAHRYRQSQSLCVSALEHALYGCFMFTVGLGAYFYHGAALAR